MDNRFFSILYSILLFLSISCGSSSKKLSSKPAVNKNEMNEEVKADKAKLTSSEKVVLDYAIRNSPDKIDPELLTKENLKAAFDEAKIRTRIGLVYWHANTVILDQKTYFHKNKSYATISQLKNSKMIDLTALSFGYVARDLMKPNKDYFAIIFSPTEIVATDNKYYIATSHGTIRYTDKKSPPFGGETIPATKKSIEEIIQFKIAEKPR
ncbi:MAG: hypothetical protein COA79_23270 [Planctomycetota bacterium]|nr:MAG: hypothetical protein COA79_23270 [Planctomycetota bacterium]